MWGRSLSSKYYLYSSAIDWFRSPNKSYKNGSVGWKVLVLAFPLVGNWKTWRVGNKKSIRIGKDPWIGVGKNYKLVRPLLIQLKSQRINKLADAESQHPQLREREGWKDVESLSLSGGEAEECNSYVNMLVAIFFHLDEGYPDKLIWTKNAVNGDFSSNKGYEEAILDQFDKDKCWWWNKLWENNIPLKTILTFWLAMNNILLTWENMRKQGFQGHSLCVLCKSNEEHSSHLFNYCPYVGDIWTTAAKTFTQDA